MKTIQALWDETPKGERITDSTYLQVCELVGFFFHSSFPEFARLWPHVWECTPEGAKGFVLVRIAEKFKQAERDEGRKLSPQERAKLLEVERAEVIRRYFQD